MIVFQNFSFQFPNGNVRTFENVSYSTKGGDLLRFLLHEYGKKNTEGYGLTLDSSSTTSSCVWVGEEVEVGGLLPVDNPLLYVSVRPLSMVVYLPEEERGEENGEEENGEMGGEEKEEGEVREKGKGKREMLDVDVSAPLVDLLSSLSCSKVLPSPPTHYTLSCLLEGGEGEDEGKRVNVRLDRPLRPQLSEKNLKLSDVSIVIEEVFFLSSF